MREIVLGQINASLKIKDGEDIIVFAGSHVFHGKFKKMMKANLGICIEIDMQKDKLEKTILVDVEIPCDSIDAIGKPKKEGVQRVPDSKIIEEKSKED